MKIISLVDNKAASGDLGAEHGLSLYIETGERKILFDTGASGLFAANAAKLGIDLSKVDTVIISHGHYDHGGGLKTFLSINKNAKVYVKKEAFKDFYSVREGETHPIGLDIKLMKRARIKKTNGDTDLGGGLKLFSITAISDPLFSTNSNLKVQTPCGLVEDSFQHEQNLILHEGGKSVLIAGCAHNGITNIIKGFISIEGSPPDYAVGGFHLCNPSNNYCESNLVIDALAAKLSKYNTVFYTGHCTGELPYSRLKESMGKNINYLAAGDTIVI